MRTAKSDHPTQAPLATVRRLKISGSFRNNNFATQIHAQGGLAMSRNIVTAVTVGLTAATVVFIWFGSIRVEPETAATVARADAAAVAAPVISPLDIMMRHSETLPVEQWRDPF